MGVPSFDRAYRETLFKDLFLRSTWLTFFNSLDTKINSDNKPEFILIYKPLALFIKQINFLSVNPAGISYSTAARF